MPVDFVRCLWATFIKFNFASLCSIFFPLCLICIKCTFYVCFLHIIGSLVKRKMVMKATGHYIIIQMTSRLWFNRSGLEHSQATHAIYASDHKVKCRIYHLLSCCVIMCCCYYYCYHSMHLQDNTHRPNKEILTIGTAYVWVCVWQAKTVDTLLLDGHWDTHKRPYA